MREEIEAEFYHLIQLLGVDEGTYPLMVELSIQSQRADWDLDDGIDYEEEKRLAVAKCRKRIENAKALCLTGDISPDEYLRIKERNDRDIAHWETRTNSIKEAALEFTLCVETIRNTV